MKDNLVIANNLPGSLWDTTKEEACPQYYSRYQIDGPPSVLQQPLLKIPKLFVVLRLQYLVCSSEIQRQSAQQARLNLKTLLNNVKTRRYQLFTDIHKGLFNKDNMAVKPPDIFSCNSTEQDGTKWPGNESNYRRDVDM
ncbi:hypothetical protein M9H77_15442 [Catharanthus roseus]|uniref:Uncharacterized protein n=1 Tax=Catharanthus roseus TaxID=4058 RepID=A0ACC0AXI1_CATRO|nr:hypothetical protein M9H77_15442 [Catharanthus roseus]